MQAYLQLLTCCTHREVAAILEPDTHCMIFSAHTCVLSRFSHGQLFVPLWTVDDQAPLSMGLSRQEYWSRFPCPPPGIFPHPNRLQNTALHEATLLGRAGRECIAALLGYVPWPLGDTPTATVIPLLVCEDFRGSWCPNS